VVDEQGVASNFNRKDFSVRKFRFKTLQDLLSSDMPVSSAGSDEQRKATCSSFKELRRILLSGSDKQNDKIGER